MANGNCRWKRSESVPYPSVWLRFNGRKEINGVIPKFWVQDIPETETEEILNYMCNNFSREEPLFRYSELIKDEVSFKEVREIWRELLKDKVGLVCYMENPEPNGKPIIAGMNCTYVKSKCDPPLQLIGEKCNMLNDTLIFLSKQKDAFEAVGTDEVLTAAGLYVLPQFRGQGLGLEILKTREPLCKAVGLKATLTAFTATVSQALANKAEFQLLTETSYEDLQKLNPNLKYPGIEKHSKMLKYMYKIY